MRTTSIFVRAVLVGLSCVLTACGGGGAPPPPSSGGGGGSGGGGSGGGGSSLVLGLIAVDTDHVNGVAETPSGSICVAGVTLDVDDKPFADHVSVDANLLGSTVQDLEGESALDPHAVAQDATPTTIAGHSVMDSGNREAMEWAVNGDGSGTNFAPGSGLSHVNGASLNNVFVGRLGNRAAISLPGSSRTLVELTTPALALIATVGNGISESNPGDSNFPGSQRWAIGGSVDLGGALVATIWVLDINDQVIGEYNIPRPANVTEMVGTSISEDGSHIGGGMTINGVQVAFIGVWNSANNAYDIKPAPVEGVVMKVSNEGLAFGGTLNDGFGTNEHIRANFGSDAAFVWHPDWVFAYNFRSYLSTEAGFDTSMFATIDLPSRGRQYVDPADPLMSYLVIGGSGENLLGAQQGFVARLEINTLEPIAASMMALP